MATKSLQMATKSLLSLDAASSFRRMPDQVLYLKANIYNIPEVSLFFQLQINIKRTRQVHSFRNCVWRCVRNGGRRLRTIPAGRIPRACYCPSGVLPVCSSARQGHKSQGERRVLARLTLISLHTFPSAIVPANNACCAGCGRLPWLACVSEFTHFLFLSWILLIQFPQSFRNWTRRLWITPSQGQGIF